MNLQSVLEEFPSSDAAQRALIAEKYSIAELDDLQDVVIFGAARLGELIAAKLISRGVRVRAFSDNDQTRWGSKHADLEILPPSQIDTGTRIVVASMFVKDIVGSQRQARCQLPIPHYVLSLLFPNDFPSMFHTLSASAIQSESNRVAMAYSLLGDDQSREVFLSLLKFRASSDPSDLPDPVQNQYFPEDLISLSTEEIFIDVGACGGDTLQDFLRRAQGKFSAYIAFEPDPANITGLLATINRFNAKNINVVRSGAGSERKVVGFSTGHGAQSKISEHGDNKISVVPIDDVMMTGGAGKPVTFIKIDVEGYEQEVLLGAVRTISKDLPKLAISVYHNPTDLWRIPMWINSVTESYSYYLRHHAPEIYETVLYCIPKAIR